MTWLSARELLQMRADMVNLLPDTCDILTVAYTRDGEGGLTEVWGTATADVACRLDYVSGAEAEVGGALQPQWRAKLSLPYDTALTVKNRVKVGDAVFAVKTVNSEQSWRVAIRADLERVL